MALEPILSRKGPLHGRFSDRHVRSGGVPPHSPPAESADSRASAFRGSALRDVVVRLMAILLGAAPPATAQDLDPRLIRARCEAVHQIENQSVLYGFVVDGATETPLPGSTVRLSWVTVRGVSDSTLHEAKADAAEGAYIFCDVPQRTRLLVQADALGQMGRAAELWFEGGELERRDLTLALASAKGGLAGRFVDAITGEGIGNVTIDIPSADVRSLSDADGHFRIDDVATGSFEAMARHIAYGDPTFLVLIQDRQTAWVEVRLTPTPVAVEPIAVTIEYRPQWLERTGFFDRVASHLGQFVTPEDMESHRWRRFSEILRNVPGVQIAETCTPHCAQVLRMSTTTQSHCSPTFYVDGRRMSFRERVIDLDAIAPGYDVEAVEVYRGISQTPPQFYGRCGSVVIWTRRGTG